MCNNCNQEIKINQEKMCHMNLILYSDSLTDLVDRREAVDICIRTH